VLTAFTCDLELRAVCCSFAPANVGLSVSSEPTSGEMERLHSLTGQSDVPEMVHLVKRGAGIEWF
jgi:hypothetical protein